jgi:hypothetical protein
MMQVQEQVRVQEHSERSGALYLRNVNSRFLFQLRVCLSSFFRRTKSAAGNFAATAITTAVVSTTVTTTAAAAAAAAAGLQLRQSSRRVPASTLLVHLGTRSDTYVQ